MIKMIVFLLLIGSFGALVASETPETSYQMRNTEVVAAALPSTENLDEKAMPLSKLIADKQSLLAGGQNLLEKSQVAVNLPGTRNLAEKRIPDPVLQKFFRPSLESDQEDPEQRRVAQ